MKRTSILFIVFVFLTSFYSYGQSSHMGKYRQAVEYVKTHIDDHGYLEQQLEYEKRAKAHQKPYFFKIFYQDNTLAIDPELWRAEGRKQIWVGRLSGKATDDVRKNRCVNSEKPMWVFVFGPTLARWKEICDKAPSSNTRERFYELLGTDGHNQPDSIVIFRVHVSDIMSPSYWPDVNQKVDAYQVEALRDQNTSLTGQPLYQWSSTVKRNEFLRYLYIYWSKNPCTRLGYTFDYAHIDEEDFSPQQYIGVPEVIVRCGAKIILNPEIIAIKDLYKRIHND